MIRAVLALSLLVSCSAHAGEVFKCTDAGGSISYQTLPCAGGAQTDRVEVDDTPDPGYEAPTYPRYGSPEETEQERKARIRNKLTSENNRAMDEYYKARCTRYEGYLQDAENEWNRLRRQGYRQSEKEYHENLINKRRREKDLRCN